MKLQRLQRLSVAISSRGCWTQPSPVEPDCADNEARGPAAKRPRMDYDDPLCCLEALLEADPVGASRPTNVEEEIAAYLDQPPIPHTSCE